MAFDNMTKIGPCEVLFGPEGAEVDIGMTNGDVVIHIAEDDAPVRHSQSGTNLWDAVITGMPISVEAVLGELTYNNMLQVMAGATLLAEGATPENYALDVQIPLGYSRRDHAKRLILKPYAGKQPSTDKHDWMYFPLAHPKLEAELPYGAEAQRGFKVVFQCFPLSVAVPRMMFWGDEDLIT